jgi:hypothetical protein
MERIVIKTMAECIAEGQIDRARVEATTEDEIRQQMLEDGEHPDDLETGYGARRVISLPTPAQR